MHLYFVKRCRAFGYLEFREKQLCDFSGVKFCSTETKLFSLSKRRFALCASPRHKKEAHLRPRHKVEAHLRPPSGRHCLPPTPMAALFDDEILRRT